MTKVAVFEFTPEFEHPHNQKSLLKFYNFLGETFGKYKPDIKASDFLIEGEKRIPEGMIATLKNYFTETDAIVFLLGGEHSQCYNFNLGFSVGSSLSNSKPILFVCKDSSDYLPYDDNGLIFCFDELYSENAQLAIKHYLEGKYDLFWFYYSKHIANEFMTTHGIVGLILKSDGDLIDKAPNKDPSKITTSHLKHNALEYSILNYQNFEQDIFRILHQKYIVHFPSSTASSEGRQTISIFLASSSELRLDRDEFELYFRRQNDLWVKKHIYINVIRWENFLDAMSETRLQDEYNKQIKSCDIFVSLFFTKVGRFTSEEFEIAHEQFKAKGKPYIYTYFKQTEIHSSSITRDYFSLLDFQDKLSNLGHFYSKYENIDDLKRQFRDQLDRLLDDRK